MKCGGVVVVEQEFAADRIIVEIFSPIGAKVKEQNFDMQATEAIRLSGFNVSGTYLNFYSDEAYMNDDDRYGGRAVRLVKDLQ